MNCRAVLELLSVRLDGELGAAEAAQFDAHLETCTRCAQEYASLERAVASLAVGPLAATPREHVAAVMAGVMQSSNGSARVRRAAPIWVVCASHLAAAAIGAFVLYLLWDRAEQERQLDGVTTEVAENTAPEPAPVVEPELVAAPRYVVLPIALEYTRRAPVTVIAHPDDALARGLAASNARLADEAHDLADAVRRGAAILGALADATQRAERRSLEVLAALEAAEDRRSELDTLARPERAPIAAAPKRIDELHDAVGPGPVAMSRDGDRVVIATRGTLEDIVPALLAHLDDPDFAVRAAVERRLGDIAREYGLAAPNSDAAREDPWWRSQRGRAMPGADEPREPDAQAWKDWWARTRSRVASL